MKKIAELRIGTKQICGGMNGMYGTPTLFLTQHSTYNRAWRQQYQGYCILCGNAFLFESTGGSYLKTTCPTCGKIHKQHEIMYSKDCNAHLPYNLRLTVIDFKNKIELRLTYSALQINQHIYKTSKYLHLKEVYTFDIEHEKVSWIKSYDNGHIAEKKEIGYLNDYEALTEKTALWFYDFKHPIYKGNSFTEILRTIRSLVNKKMRNLGKSTKNLYIGGQYKNKLYANILNLAHKVRFWDSENVPYGNDYIYWYKDQQLNLLPQKWEQIVETKQKKIGYIAAMIEYLKLSNIPQVRKEIRYKNLMLLQACYADGKLDIDSAKTLYEFAKEKERYLQKNQYRWQEKHCLAEIQTIADFYREFSIIYPKELKMQNLLDKWESTYADIKNLWENADKITKEEFYSQHIKLKNLHDWLAIAVAKQKDRELIFDVPQEIINRYSLALNNLTGGQMITKCIEKNSELKLWATSLKNCAAGYRNRINSSRQLVGISDEKGKPIALIEIEKGSLVQAKLINNRPVKENNEVNSIVLKFIEKCSLQTATQDIEIEKKEKTTESAA